MARKQRTNWLRSSFGSHFAGDGIFRETFPEEQERVVVTSVRERQKGCRLPTRQDDPVAEASPVKVYKIDVREPVKS